MASFITVVSLFTFSTAEIGNRLNETFRAVMANARKANPGTEPDLYAWVVPQKDGSLDFHFSTEEDSEPEGSVIVKFGDWDVRMRDLVPPVLIEQFGESFYEDFVSFRQAVLNASKAA